MSHSTRSVTSLQYNHSCQCIVRDQTSLNCFNFVAFVVCKTPLNLIHTQYKYYIHKFISKSEHFAFSSENIFPIFSKNTMSRSPGAHFHGHWKILKLLARSCDFYGSPYISIRYQTSGVYMRLENLVVQNMSFLSDHNFLENCF